MHSYYDLLISLGAHITNKGCRYIAEAILLLQKKDPSSWPTAGQLYQQVAHKFQFSPCSFSRAVLVSSSISGLLEIDKNCKKSSAAFFQKSQRLPILFLCWPTIWTASAFFLHAEFSMQKGCRKASLLFSDIHEIWILFFWSSFFICPLDTAII